VSVRRDGGGSTMTMENRLPARLACGPGGLGATVLGDGRTRFALWAPKARRVAVDLGQGRLVGLGAGDSGYHLGVVEECPPGTRYRFVLDDGPPLADPASRLQPEGVFGPSAVADLGAHRWGEGAYRPKPLAEQVISESHIGTLTGAGTFDAAVAVLDELVEVGITALEIMPVAEFPGSRNWGYDGVFPFSVRASYGGPAGLQRLVEECHRRGLAVVLDVVHNHQGPLGSVLDAYGPYFNQRYRTPWGPALNFDGPGSDHVRAFYFESVAQWFCDYHLDGLRLDAIHAIVDTTAIPFVAELSELAAFLGERLGRPCWLVAESTDNDPRVVAPRGSGGQGMDAQWNDDFHHALHVALTGERGAYYADYGGSGDVARAINEAFVLQGQYSTYRRRRHGAPSSAVEPEQLVVYAQNHDQIGNRPGGERLPALVGLDAHRLALAVVLLGPGVPLLFMGDEYGETAPFPFFVDHGDPAVAAATHQGRAGLLARMGFVEVPLDESAEATFRAAILDRSLRAAPGHAEVLALTRHLIALRRSHPALGRARRDGVSATVEGRVLTLVRKHKGDRDRFLGLFNLGPEPASAPMHHLGRREGWRLLLDSADPAHGGTGARQPEAPGGNDSLALGPWAFCAYGTTTGIGAP
jgi:maltooligosyltrehalose trehalohydrolase